MMPATCCASSARASSAPPMRERSAAAGRRRGARLLLGLLVLLGLGACASSPTPYRSASDRFGYSEQQLESNRYRVSFAGNAATALDTVRDYALFRAAELTVASGHDYFRVVNQSTDTRSSGVGGPRIGVGVGSGGSGSGLGVGISSILGGGGGYAGDYTVTMDVLMFDGEKPAADPDAYDAREVLRRLQPTIQRPAA
jgi:hypothetical protein